MDESQSPHTGSQKVQILTSVRATSLKWASQQLASYLDALEQKLFKLADRAENNESQSCFFRASDEIRQHRNVIDQNYQSEMTKAFEQYRSNKVTTNDFTLDPLKHQHAPYTEAYEQNLSLVDDNELEEQLAISTMVRKASADYSEAIYALNQRLAVLRGGAKMNEQGNPVAPGVFGEALQAAIAQLQLDNRAKLIIYKVFDSSFMAELGKLYQLLNHHCESNGVLPNLSYYVVKQQDENISEQLPEELKQQASDSTMAKQLELYNAISQLQAMLQARLPRARPADAISVPLDQVIAAIQQLQLNAGNQLSSYSTPQAVAASDIHGLQQQAMEHTSRVEDIDAGVVEIVGLLFEFVLNDQQLPDSVKTLLCYLQTPFIKIALVNRNFFNHPEHPARQLLNSLVAAGERWVEPSGAHKNDVFQKIKSTVERLLKEYDNNEQLFAELSFEFNSYLRQHAHRIRLAEKRAAQAAQGENKLKEIRLKVNSYLKKKVGKMTLPPTIQTLLHEPWANFLSFNLLRYGSGSEQWRQAAQVVDDIIWYCQPHNIETDFHARTRIQELQQQLPIALQAGFDTVGYDSVQGKHLLEVLHELQKTATASATANSVVEHASAAHIDEIDISAPVKAAMQHDQQLRQLKNLQVGTWLELNSKSKEPQRVKLAWANTHTMHFMFVNRMGQQVTVKYGPQLATEISNGTVKVLKALEDKPFFEKAMERVLEQLKQRADTSTG